MIKKVMALALALSIFALCAYSAVMLGSAKGDNHLMSAAQVSEGPFLFTDTGSVSVKFDRAIAPQCSTKIRGFLVQSGQSPVTLEIQDLPGELVGELDGLIWSITTLPVLEGWNLKIWIDTNCGFMRSGSYKLDAGKLEII